MGAGHERFKAGCNLCKACKAPSTLVCSPSRVQMSLGCLPSLPSLEGPNFFLLNTEELLKNALLFSIFLWNLLAFYSAQLKTQQMPPERKAGGGGRGRGMHLLSLWHLASQVLVALAALNHNFFFFLISSSMKKAVLALLLLNSCTLPLPEPTNVWRSWLPWQLTNAFV